MSRSANTTVPFSGLGISITGLIFRMRKLGHASLKKIWSTWYNTIRFISSFVSQTYKQLHDSRLKRFAFEDFEEGILTFDPTYKYDNGTNTYDTRWGSISKALILEVKRQGHLHGLIVSFTEAEMYA